MGDIVKFQRPSRPKPNPAEPMGRVRDMAGRVWRTDAHIGATFLGDIVIRRPVWDREWHECFVVGGGMVESGIVGYGPTTGAAFNDYWIKVHAAYKEHREEERKAKEKAAEKPQRRPFWPWTRKDKDGPDKA